MEGKEERVGLLGLRCLLPLWPGHRDSLAPPSPRLHLGLGHHLQRLHAVSHQDLPEGRQPGAGVEGASVAAGHEGRGGPGTTLDQVVNFLNSSSTI